MYLFIHPKDLCYRTIILCEEITDEHQKKYFYRLKQKVWIGDRILVTYRINFLSGPPPYSKILGIEKEASLIRCLLKDALTDYFEVIGSSEKRF